MPYFQVNFRTKINDEIWKFSPQIKSECIFDETLQSWLLAFMYILNDCELMSFGSN